ncbi:hypothetical protein DID88_009996 [Monilinia fructigena]|uniref:Uncharacterized protein n=1 Tax=Monilinia fructigena TaxID=38457 RepID=A0A395IMA6_9HELO|nr:hypothetical protein DID88_009996 [Monilinia fructigena]
MKFLDDVYEVAAHLDPIYPLSIGGKFQSSREVVWRTILADSYEKEHPAPQQCEELMAQYQEWVRNGAKAAYSMQRLSIAEKQQRKIRKRGFFLALKKKSKLRMMLEVYFEPKKAI